MLDGDEATGTTITGATDCSGFTYDICSGLCQQCDISIIPLMCNSVHFMMVLIGLIV